MMRYHGKRRGNVNALSEARSILRSCPVTWKTTHLDREQPFFYDDHASQSQFDRAIFFGYTPTIPGLSSSTREMVDLATGLKFWRSCVLSRARQMVTFPGNTTPHSPPVTYKTWLNKLFPSEAPRSASMKHRKGKSLPAGVHPSTLVFQSSGSSMRKRSSSSTVEDRDPKHSRGARKDSSSSRGSRVVSPVCRSSEGATHSVVPDSLVAVSSSVSDREHTKLVDTGEYHECLAIAQGVVSILHTEVSSLWSCICTGLEGKSPEMVLKEEESAMNIFPTYMTSCRASFKRRERWMQHQ
ncbi:hypothetical protein LIER_08952 [Lithospermum erythrorhizon]|uniref:Uncharacterized protein n=1 Tax=Lithospermum erythrorhizon TaxID=34254 RepID=A0AAV3PFX6_LITER